MTSQAPASSSSISTGTSSKPPVSFQPTTHLDPGAYVRGSHPISLGNNTLVHPRAHISSVHGDLNIGDSCIISEKCIIGGPLPVSSTEPKSNTTSTSSPNPDTISSPNIPGPSTPTATSIASQVHIHSHAAVHYGASIASFAVIEAHATILPNVHIGEHSKICAGITVDRDVPEWTVVYGDGHARRQRGRSDEAESGRLLAMNRERDATVALLRNIARMASVARRK